MKENKKEKELYLDYRRVSFWNDLGYLHKSVFLSKGINSALDLESMTAFTFSILTGYGERGVNSINKKLRSHGLSFKSK